MFFNSDSITPVTTQIDKASFTFWSKEDIKKISIKKITNVKSFEVPGQAHEDGLYSAAMGPVERFKKCPTCQHDDDQCIGHYGHIDLSVPVFHPMLIQIMNMILDKCCLNCYHFRMPPASMKLLLAQIEALNRGLDHLVDELEEIAMEMFASLSDKDPSLQQVLEEKLSQRLEEETLKYPGSKENQRSQLRSIVERLSILYRRFLNNKLVKPLKTCHLCGTKKVTLYLTNQSVLALGKGGETNIESLKEAKRKASKKSISIEEVHGARAEMKRTNPLSLLSTDDKQVFTPIGVAYFFKRLWENESDTLERLFHFLKPSQSETKQNDDSSSPNKKFKKSYPTDKFFIETLLVMPNKFRPPMMQRGYTYEGPRTSQLSHILKQSLVVEDLIAVLKKEKKDDHLLGSLRTENEAALQRQWAKLQVMVNCLYDNEMDKYADEKKKIPGLKQLIDKKEGLFRKNMMGKRVNFAARSVISPDPNIRVDEIGVPMVFASKLTYPQPVTPWNIEQLRKAVLNGDKYPGAASVVFSDGTKITLKKEKNRLTMANLLTYHPKSRPSNSIEQTPQVMIVNRHLLCGDVLLFNRQPTLHKPSIMAFKARVLPNEKGFRLHYANCKSFNADFDGDEMNAHFPQSELARSEAYNIASVNYQYLVPKDGSPLGGLIQDHVVAVCILTNRNEFLDMERYNQLVFAALNFLGNKIVTEPPTIYKPVRLWTGKQVVTTIIKNCCPSNKPLLSLNIKSKISPKILHIKPEYEDLSDCHVVIQKGELIRGFIDKANIGATQYGLVHMCYELYGGETSSAIMSSFSRLATIYLQLYEGFTLGIKDILVEDSANEERRRLIKESLQVGPDSAKEALNLKGKVNQDELVNKLQASHSDRDPLPMKKLDAAMKQRTDKIASSISSKCLPDGLIVKFPANNLQMMIQSGAKGGTVNALQISCLLGQIELEGRRVPLSMSGRTLPAFRPYDTSPKAGGFVSGRFLTGIQPEEFFFHCMAGREGLIDTAVKTSRSGYLQRCLIKHLEGLTVQYDQTVRDSCGSVIQFLYGEDGLDIVRSQLLKSKAFKLLIDNNEIIAPSDEELKTLNKGKVHYEEEMISRANDIEEWLLKNNSTDRSATIRGSGFLDFMKHLRELGCYDQNEALEKWYELSFKEKRIWSKFWERCPDPVVSQMNPAAHFGSVPEKLDDLLSEFCDNNRNLLLNPANELELSFIKYEEEMYPGIKNKPKLTRMDFYELCYNMYMKMLAQPGEAVGLLAAQSIGEPSTQMTLNTFHFAGRGEMNVTLGIPRLREILMTASAKIGTPSMDLPLKKLLQDDNGITMSKEQAEEAAQSVKLALNAIRLSDVLECVELEENLIAEVQNSVDSKVRSKKSKSRDSQIPVAYGGKKEKKTLYLMCKLKFVILPSKYYKDEFNTSSKRVMKFIEESFVDQLVDSIVRRQKRLAIAESIFDVSSRKMIRSMSAKRQGEIGAEDNGGSGAGGADDEDGDVDEEGLNNFNRKAREKAQAKENDESSSDDEDDGENDVTANRARNRRNQDLDYEEPEDEDLEVGEVDAKNGPVDDDQDNEDDDIVEVDEHGQVVETLDSADDDDDKHARGNFIDLAEDERVGNEQDEDDDEGKRQTRSTSKAARYTPDEINSRRQRVKNKRLVVEYEFDTRRERWCELTLQIDNGTSPIDMASLVDTEARRTFVHRVGNISRALLVKDVNASDRNAICDKMIKTEGVSLLSLVKFGDVLDLNSIYSNDIHAIANTYGIEAASRAIVREMTNVFAVYGIEVDSRHLSLIGDYMTCSGAIRGMNRASMEASASPFQQMSFESTCRYMKWATILGLHDNIKSPSAALVFGKPTMGGTGLLNTRAKLVDMNTAPQVHHPLSRQNRRSLFNNSGSYRFNKKRNSFANSSPSKRARTHL